MSIRKKLMPGAPLTCKIKRSPSVTLTGWQLVTTTYCDEFKLSAMHASNRSATDPLACNRL